MKQKAIALLSAVLLTACATTGDKIKHVREGMPKSEVIMLLGQPDGFKRSGEYEALTYISRPITGMDNAGRADYTVILRDGNVVEYGAGNVREPQNKAGILLLVPMSY